MLRKNTTVFSKLSNGKFGLRAWYPHLKPTKGAPAAEGVTEAVADAADAEEETEVAASPVQEEAAAA